jgi:hypothetical protein
MTRREQHGPRLRAAPLPVPRSRIPLPVRRRRAAQLRPAASRRGRAATVGVCGAACGVRWRGRHPGNQKMRTVSCRVGLTMTDAELRFPIRLLTSSGGDRPGVRFGLGRAVRGIDGGGGSASFCPAKLPSLT